MERPKSYLTERESFIQAIYKDKKGRDTFSKNPFTCYINIDSPNPNLPLLTASFFDQLLANSYDAKVWASTFDKSMISVAPSGKTFCDFLPDYDSKGKNYVPVVTTKIVNVQEILESMPKGEEAYIGINDQPMTIDAFLISYFHMVNELIWDKARERGKDEVNYQTYMEGLKEVTGKGFSVGVVNELKIIEAKQNDPSLSVRIYGSKVNPYVPEIMGAIF